MDELEKKLSQAISVPFVIMGMPDEEFGEKITIVFEGETPHNFKDLIEGLDFFEKPKKVFNLDVFPRNNNKVLRRKIITKISQRPTFFKKIILPICDTTNHRMVC